MDILLKNILYLIDANYNKDEDFEVAFGIAKTTVSAWRRGKLKSYEKHAPKIATFFKVSLDWLTGNEQKNKPTVNNDAELDELLDIFESLSATKRKKLLVQARLEVDEQNAEVK